MDNYKVYPNVKIGKNAVIGDFVIIGHPPRGKEPGELETVIGDGAVIRSHTVIYSGNIIGDNLQTGHFVTIREYNDIGNNVSVGIGSIIEHHIRIEDNVRFHGHSGIGEYSVFEEGSWIGPRVVFINVLHPGCPKAKECLIGPTIKKKAIVGANVILYPGVVIGEHALLGAGAVIREDVPPHSVVVGNPSKVVGNVFELDCPYNLIERPYYMEKSI